MITQLLSSFVQLGVFMFIPYIAFIFRKDRAETFFQYLGIYKAETKSMVFSIASALLFLVAGVGFAFFNERILMALQSPDNIVGSLRGSVLTWESFFLIILIAWVKTSLSEEIFFRGFIGKRLIKRFGFSIGNMVQALVFGGVHVILFYIIVDTALGIEAFVFVFYAMAGWIIGYINERFGKGSILPGWVSHGVGNTAAFLLIDFVL